MSSDLVGGKFGYRVLQRLDGRVELVDPEPHWKRGSWGFDPNWTHASNLLGWLTFLPLLAAPIVFIVAGAVTLAAGNLAWGILSMLVGIAAAVLLVNTFFIRRTWRVAPSSIARYFEVKGLPIRYEKHYPGIERLEILHAVWHDDKGWTDSVAGWAGSRELSLTSLHRDLLRTRASQFAEFGLEKVVAPQIWWLGHQMAALSGLPLETKAGRRHAPSRGD